MKNLAIRRDVACRCVLFNFYRLAVKYLKFSDVLRKTLPLNTVFCGGSTVAMSMLE
jgi:hypothetical protein